MTQLEGPTVQEDVHMRSKLIEVSSWLLAGLSVTHEELEVPPISAPAAVGTVT